MNWHTPSAPAIVRWLDEGTDMLSAIGIYVCVAAAIIVLLPCVALAHLGKWSYNHIRGALP